MTIHFVTYFTSEFVTIGIASVARFLRFHPNSLGNIFTFDEPTSDILRKRFANAGVNIINVFQSESIASKYNSLLTDRNDLEVITSLKPLFIRLSLQELADNDQLIYFDPDVMHFSHTPSLSSKSVLVFKQIGLSSASAKKFGEFNAGLVLLKKDQTSLTLLRDWEEKCYAWCKLQELDGLYGDQKYLDSFKNIPGFGYQESFQNNLSARAFTSNQEIRLSKNSSGFVLINDQALVSFHFHGIRLKEDKILTGFNRFGRIHSKVKLFLYIYVPILHEITSEHSALKGKNETSIALISRFDKTIFYSKHRWGSIPLLNFLVSFFRMINFTEIPVFIIRFLSKRLVGPK